MRKFIIIMALLSAAWLPALADGSRRDGPGALSSNWYVQAGGGVNTVFCASSFGPLSPAADLRVGWWLTPAFGFRVGALGLSNRPNGTDLGWFSGRDRFGFWHGDVDIVWNMSNTVSPYREDRLWDIQPFARLAGIVTLTGDGRGLEAGAGAGVHNDFRLGRRVGLYVEVSAVAAREKAWRQQGNVIVFPSVTAGVEVRIGRQGFRKAPSDIIYEPVYIDRTDTVTVEKERVVVERETVVDSVLIQQMRETPLTLYFEIDQTVLTEREKAHLERYAHFVLTPESKVLLVGSADRETGNPERNQRLSEGRCATLKSILVNTYGLDPRNIVEVANGDRKNEFNTPEKNRCVTLSIIE